MARQAPAILPTIPSFDIIPIEIVELQLQSVAPITVTGINPPEQWEVIVTLPPSPQPPGVMRIDHLDPQGGTWDSDLPVCPLFTFTRISGPPAAVVFDLCGEAFPPVQVQALGAPWTHLVQLPLQCGPPNPQPSTPNFLAQGPHTGPHSPQPLEQPAPQVPVLGRWGFALLLVLLVAVGANLTGRRMRAQRAG